MELVIWLLLALPAVVLGCEPDSQRRDCLPWDDDTEVDCIARGCEWCSSPVEGVPWCYYKDKVCPSTIAEGSRVDCLPGGGDRADCLAQNCIWCESPTQGVPWCFHDTTVSLGGTNCPVTISDSERIDCHPDPNANEQTCLARGCHWCSSPTQNVPWCFAPKKQGYRMVGTAVSTAKGYQVDLVRINTPSWFGGDIDNVRMDVEFQTLERLRIKFYDPSVTRWEVPVNIESPSTAASITAYDITFSNDPVFSFKVIRKSTGATIFDTSIGGFQFSDQFIQVASYLDNAAVYGFGEHEHPSFRHDMNWKTWGMWARDQAVTTSNLYGHQPFYMSVEKSNNAHGVLFLNSNAQDVTLMPHPALTFRTIGGILDMYFFLGPSPDRVVQEYMNAIQPPVMIPYWALGYQLCRWGYTDLAHMKAAVARHRLHNIPHDVQYGDIDYMDGALDFTIDPVNFAGLPAYVDQLKEEGTRFVIILDPAISFKQTPGSYPPFDEGEQMDVWVKESNGFTSAAGEVWPGDVYYPDYTKPITEVWWTAEVKKFKTQLDFAGIWIDMNEPANFIDGKVGGCANNRWNNPPYVPKIADRSLWRSTLCPDNMQHIGRHYDTHSLYGWSMSKQSVAAARETLSGSRSVVFSRSTFPGSGQWAQHWLGDNWSRWDNLRFSIIGMFDFNLFGYPYIGPDICGFIGQATEEMCLRWHQLGAFYPFSRAHNAQGEADQDPGMWNEVARVTRESLEIRYTLLPFLYTLFHYAHTSGSTVIRPLMFEFIEETVTHSINDQFLWGGGLMICPVLDQGVTGIQVYFPDARWYSYYNGLEETSRLGWKVVGAPLDFIPLFVRGGYILPTQNPANSTMWSRSNPMGLIVALDDAGDASGSLFWDDGEENDSYGKGQYFLANYALSNSQLTSSVQMNGYPEVNSLIMDTIRVFGVTRIISQVTIDEVPFNDWVHHPINKELTISNAAIPVNHNFVITW